MSQVQGGDGCPPCSAHLRGEKNETLKSMVNQIKEKKANLTDELREVKLISENDEHDKLQTQDELNQARIQIADLLETIQFLQNQRDALQELLEDAHDAADMFEGQLNDAQEGIEQLMATQAQQEPQPLGVDDALVIIGAFGIKCWNTHEACNGVPVVPIVVVLSQS